MEVCHTQHCHQLSRSTSQLIDFILPFLPPYMYMGVIPNPKMAFIFPIPCILVLIFPIFITCFPKCEGKCSFKKSQIKSLQLKFNLGQCCAHPVGAFCIANLFRLNMTCTIFTQLRGLGCFTLPK